MDVWQTGHLPSGHSSNSSGPLPHCLGGVLGGSGLS